MDKRIGFIKDELKRYNKQNEVLGKKQEALGQER